MAQVKNQKHARVETFKDEQNHDGLLKMEKIMREGALTSAARGGHRCIQHQALRDYLSDWKLQLVCPFIELGKTSFKIGGMCEC